MTTASLSTTTTVPPTTVPTTPPPVTAPPTTVPVTAPPTTVPVTTTTESVVAQLASWYKATLPFLNSALAMARVDLAPQGFCQDVAPSLPSYQFNHPPVATVVDPWLAVLSSYVLANMECTDWRDLTEAEQHPPSTTTYEILGAWQRMVQLITSFEATYG